MRSISKWDATSFFRSLTEKSVIAQSHAFTFCRVSGLEGFEEALQRMQSHKAFVCVSEISQGYTELCDTPHTRRVTTVFLAMRHKIDDMAARQSAMDNISALFQSFMSVLLREKTKLEQGCLYLDSRISYHEIDSYFFSGCACAYFQIAVDTYNDLTYQEDEWTESVI